MGTPVQPGNLVDLDFGLDNYGPRGQTTPEVAEAIAVKHMTGNRIFVDESGSMNSTVFQLKGKPINEMHITPEDLARALTELAVSNPKGLEFVMHLLGMGPCPTCRFVKQHCKCGNTHK